MTFVVLEICSTCVKGGFAGFDEPASIVHGMGLLDDDISWSDKAVKYAEVALYTAIAKTLDELLVQYTKTEVVVVEPPLATLRYKQRIVDVLLHKLRVRSICFLPYSVCYAVSAGRTCGLVITFSLPATNPLDAKKNTEPPFGSRPEYLYVPVFDCRELTPNIVTSFYPPTKVDASGLADIDELPCDEVVTTVKSRVGYDVAARLCLISDLAIPSVYSGLGAWIGASIICQETNLLYTLSRDNFVKGAGIYDSLFR